MLKKELTKLILVKYFLNFPKNSFTFFRSHPEEYGHVGSRKSVSKSLINLGDLSRNKECTRNYKQKNRPNS